MCFERNNDRDNEPRVSGGRSTVDSTVAMAERPFYPEMFGHVKWTELVNQMIFWTESETKTKDYWKDVYVGC